MDGTLRDAEWYQEYFSRLRNDFPAVRLAIIQISAPPEAIFERAEVRFCVVCVSMVFAAFSQNG